MFLSAAVTPPPPPPPAAVSPQSQLCALQVGVQTKQTRPEDAGHALGERFRSAPRTGQKFG